MSGYGYGGIKVISKLTNLDPRTVSSGVDEFESNQFQDLIEAKKKGLGQAQEGAAVRQKGAGRPSATELNPDLLKVINTMVEASSYGDPQSALIWSTLSLRGISDRLKTEHGIDVSKDTVSRALDRLGYSKQVNQKMLQQGKEHPQRDEIFKHIAQKSTEYLELGLPVISVDTKRKELVGNFKNNGAEYRKQGDPRLVNDHDFEMPDLGKVAPYGVYVVNDNTAFVNLGTDHDTSEFAVESIRRWWQHIGKPNFNGAKKLMITADGGGSNGWRVRLWKYELAMLAEETDLEILVCHYPTGASKFNKIEHRLFSYISRNWAGKTLVDIQTIIKLIGSTTTKKGLTVKCELDENKYAKGISVSDEQMASIDLEQCGPAPGFSYIIKEFKKCV